MRRLVRVVSAAGVVAAMLAPLAARAETVPGVCGGYRHSGPSAVSCLFHYQGPYIVGVAAGFENGSPNEAGLDIVLADDSRRVLGTCTYDRLIPGTGPSAHGCAFEEDFYLPYGTPLLCVSRGRGFSAFSCVSE